MNETVPPGTESGTKVYYFIASVFLVLFGFVVYGLVNHKPFASGVSSAAPTHTMVYRVEADAALTIPHTNLHVPYTPSRSLANVTYQNASGGTEQHLVELPWTLELREQPLGAFAYISAQKSDTFDDMSSIHVAVYEDGVLLQEATSGGEYAIASASGRVR